MQWIRDGAKDSLQQKARISAHREIEVLSHALTKAVQWGYLDLHPFKGQVRLKGERPRDRYVEDWEVVECLSLPSKRKKASVLAIAARRNASGRSDTRRHLTDGAC